MNVVPMNCEHQKELKPLITLIIDAPYAGFELGPGVTLIIHAPYVASDNRGCLTRAVSLMAVIIMP